VPMSRHWQSKLDELENAAVPTPSLVSPSAAMAIAPPAVLAAPISESKMAAERPLLRHAFAGGQVPEASTMAPAPGDRLDAGSRRLFATKCAPDVRRSPARLKNAVVRFECHMAADTLQNQGMRAVILRFLCQRPIELPMLDKWVYSSLFLTPAGDPWIGLLQPDDYTGVENGGIRR
jgi:hypothetical protein